MATGPTIWLDRVSTTSDSATGHFRVDGHRSTVRFSGVAPERASAAAAFVMLARMMGMENDQRVVSIPPISRAARRDGDVFARVHRSLYPHHHDSPLHVLPLPGRRPTAPGDPRRTAAFFSGGVDSFALLVDHGEVIDDLIFVKGFDVPVSDVERTEEVLASVVPAAEATGKPLMVLETDVRDFSDATCDWTWFVYGALIATPILLERTHKTVLVAASVADRHLPDEAVRLRGHGFGTERTDMRISGRSQTRVEKVEAVARSGIARDTLRVCWQNVAGTVNCGTCDKCVRTVAELAATGCTGMIATLPTEVDLDLLATHPAETRSDRAFLTETRDAAVAHDQPAVVAALERALAAGGTAS